MPDKNRDLYVSIDIFAACNELGGVSSYTRSIVAALEKVEDITLDPFHFPVDISFENKSVIDRLLVLLRDVVYYPFIVPLMKGKTDILFFPTQSASLFSRQPVVVVIHDLGVLHYPRQFGLWFRLYSKFTLPLIAKSAAHIITDAEFTKHDIINTLEVDASKISVIPLGLDTDKYRPPDSAERVRQIVEHYSLDRPFFLAVGTNSPRKNYKRLVEAFFELIREGEKDLQLLFVGMTGYVGMTGWKNSHLYTYIANHEYSSHVKFVGFVEHDVLMTLYGMAEALVYPSLHEGFGLPLLEAMACKCPVIASNTSSMPAVVGNAGLFCSPLDTSSIMSAMRTIVEDRALREELINRGSTRVKEFSWDTSAEKLMKIFHNMKSSSPTR